MAKSRRNTIVPWFFPIGGCRIDGGFGYAAAAGRVAAIRWGTKTAWSAQATAAPQASELPRRAPTNTAATGNTDVSQRTERRHGLRKLVLTSRRHARRHEDSEGSALGISLTKKVDFRACRARLA